MAREVTHRAHQVRVRARVLAQRRRTLLALEARVRQLALTAQLLAQLQRMQLTPEQQLRAEPQPRHVAHDQVRAALLETLVRSGCVPIDVARMT